MIRIRRCLGTVVMALLLFALSVPAASAIDPPSFSLKPGSYDYPQVLLITSASPVDKIYYTVRSAAGRIEFQGEWICLPVCPRRSRHDHRGV